MTSLYIKTSCGLVLLWSCELRMYITQRRPHIKCHYLNNALFIGCCKQKLSFNFRECCEDLRKELEDQHCELSFTQTQIRIACKLHPEESGFRELCKTWTETVSKYVRDYVSNNVEEKDDLECPATEIWDELQAYCSNGM